MVTKKSVKRFYIDARINVSTNLIINANSLEQAIEEARKLTTTDFISLSGDHNDSDLEITGVFQAE